MFTDSCGLVVALPSDNGRVPRSRFCDVRCRHSVHSMVVVVFSRALFRHLNMKPFFFDNLVLPYCHDMCVCSCHLIWRQSVGLLA